MIPHWNSVADAWAGVFLPAFIQNTFFLAAVLVLMHVMRRASARLRYGIGLIGLGKLFVPPFLPWPAGIEPSVTWARDGAGLTGIPFLSSGEGAVAVAGSPPAPSGAAILRGPAQVYEKARILGGHLGHGGKRNDPSELRGRSLELHLQDEVLTASIVDNQRPLLRFVDVDVSIPDKASVGEHDRGQDHGKQTRGENPVHLDPSCSISVLHDHESTGEVDASVGDTGTTRVHSGGGEGGPLTGDREGVAPAGTQDGPERIARGRRFDSGGMDYSMWTTRAVRTSFPDSRRTK
jgi:hypothetical protein